MGGQRLPDVLEDLDQRGAVGANVGDEFEDLQTAPLVFDEEPRPQRPGRQDAPDAERSDLFGRLEQRRGVVGQGRDSPARRRARADEPSL